MMVYVELIALLGNLILSPMILAKQSMMVTFSLGALAASQGPESPLFVLLSKFDLFLIWEIIVLGIGLSILYKVPRNKGYLLSVLSMGLLAMLHVVAAAIGSMFA